MWWEIIPPAAIIGLCLYTPFYSSYLSHKLVLGKFCRRPRLDWHDKNFWDRDEQLTGFPYNTQGLDAIPDEPLTSFNRPKAHNP